MLSRLVFTRVILAGLLAVNPAWSADQEESATDAVESTEVETGDDSEARGTLSVDPLGFLLFGPSVNAELAVGPVGVGAGFRWFSPGLLANSLFLGPGDEFAFSYGVAGRVHYYLTGDLQGAHAGLAVEYLRTRVDSDSLEISTVSSYVVPQLEGGYRYALNRFFVGGVLAVGYAAQISSRVEAQANDVDPADFRVTDESSVYGSARIDLGFFF